jgi:hypothetical protein
MHNDSSLSLPMIPFGESQQGISILFTGIKQTHSLNTLTWGAV